MHLFQHPEHADVEPVMYRKIPKKLRDRLQACPVKGSTVVGECISRKASTGSLCSPMDMLDSSAP